MKLSIEEKLAIAKEKILIQAATIEELRIALQTCAGELRDAKRDVLHRAATLKESTDTNSKLRAEVANLRRIIRIERIGAEEV